MGDQELELPGPEPFVHTLTRVVVVFFRFVQRHLPNCSCRPAPDWPPCWKYDIPAVATDGSLGRKARSRQAIGVCAHQDVRAQAQISDENIAKTVRVIGHQIVSLARKGDVLAILADGNG